MNNSFTEQTQISWFSRLKSALAGVLIGLILFLISFGVLWWNEGRTVERTKTLAIGLNSVLPVSANQVSPSANKELIHISGMLETNDIITDTALGFEAKAIRLKRKVEMYQWKENVETSTNNNMGGSQTKTKTYTYNKVWSEQLIDSASFNKSNQYKNPNAMPLSSFEKTANNVNLGVYKLGNKFTSQLSAYEKYPLNQNDYQNLNPEYKKHFKLHQSYLFRGNPTSPEIGSIRISYEVVSPHTATVVGFNNNGQINSYLTKNGSINLIKLGSYSAEEMFKQAAEENQLIAWLLRLGGIIMMWVGMYLVLKPLAILGDVVPLIGSFVAAGLIVITGIITSGLSITTIALSWIFFRPLIGVPLLLLSLGLFFCGFKVIKRKYTSLNSPQKQGTNV